MTLQKLLLKLSENKGIRIECFIADEKATIDISDWYNNNLLKQIIIDLNDKIDVKLFSQFL